MYDFHYNVMKPLFSESEEEDIRICMHDTDSFLYHITTDKFNEKMLSIQDKLDLSSYPKDYKLYNPKNRKIIGKFSNETNGQPIRDFVGLRAKMYSYLRETVNMFTKDDDHCYTMIDEFNKYSNEETSRAKGNSKIAHKRENNHKRYLDSLNGIDTARKLRSNNIRNFNHSIYTIETWKTALNPADDKRYVLPGGYDTLVHGHYLINLNKY